MPADRPLRAGRQPDRHGRAVARAVARRGDSAAVRFDEVADERQSEPEPPVSSSRAAVPLPEPIEDVRQERRSIPSPVSRTLDLHARLSACATLTAIVPPSGVNFVAFDNRFQATCRRRCASPVTHTSGARSRCTSCCFASTAGVKDSTVVRTISDRSTASAASAMPPALMTAISKAISSFTVNSWSLILKREHVLDVVIDGSHGGIFNIF